MRGVRPPSGIRRTRGAWTGGRAGFGRPPPHAAGGGSGPPAQGRDGRRSRRGRAPPRGAPGGDHDPARNCRRRRARTAGAARSPGGRRGRRHRGRRALPAGPPATPRPGRAIGRRNGGRLPPTCRRRTARDPATAMPRPRRSAGRRHRTGGAALVDCGTIARHVRMPWRIACATRARPLPSGRLLGQQGSEPDLMRRHGSTTAEKCKFSDVTVA